MCLAFPARSRYKEYIERENDMEDDFIDAQDELEESYRVWDMFQDY